MEEIIIGILSILGSIVIVILFRLFHKKLNGNTLVFSPIILVLMLYLLNLMSSNIFVEMFGNLIEWYLLIFTLMVCTIYVIFMFEKIAESNNEDENTSAIIRIGAMVLSSWVFFALIYMMHYRLSDKSAFTGSIGEEFITQLVSFFYFSLITLTTVGFGDIHPISNVARLTVMLQILLAFITVIYGISSFVHFKELFKHNSPFATSKNNTTEDDSKKK